MLQLIALGGTKLSRRTVYYRRPGPIQISTNFYAAGTFPIADRIRRLTESLKMAQHS